MTASTRRLRLSPIALALLAYGATALAQTPAPAPTAPSTANADAATPTLEQVNIRDTYEREDLPLLAPGARPPRVRGWAFWAPPRS